MASLNVQKADEALPELLPLHPSAANLKILGRHFIDEHGRTVAPRGVNVSASSKVPQHPTPSIDRHADVTYVGRPFPLEEADEHWRRLKAWGLTFLRITVTWDAIEHAGPGQYDEEYLEYLGKLLRSMEKHGIFCYVAMHQDVWSRYCGGSGAPGWTLEKVGFDLSNDGEKLAVSGAAFLDGIRGGRLRGERGLWPTGYQKLASATMNTLFWGGETFAPSLMIDHAGKPTNVQQYLQDHFLGAVDRLAATIGDIDSVMGIELLNEPHPGFIGLENLSDWNYNTDLHLGQFPSPLQSFSLGAGHSTEVRIWERSFPWPTKAGKLVIANSAGVSVWRPDGPTKGSCPWENEAVWRWSEQKQKAVGLQGDYFCKDRKGKKVDFYQNFYFPFVRRWEDVVGKRMGGKARMIEGLPNEFCPTWPEADRPKNLVFTPHWYDLNALFKKEFGNMTVNVQGLSRGMFLLKALYWGPHGAKKNYRSQIAKIVLAAMDKLGDVPVVIGETGVPMDINKEHAINTGDWRWQERMMDSIISAMESSMVGFNLWTYNPTNSDELGDDWNAENFSFFSESNRLKSADPSDLDAGARLLDAIVRPYAVATSGTPISHDYDTETSVFTYRYRTPLRLSKSIPAQADLSEFFIPKRIYPEGKTSIQLSSGGRCTFDWPNERLYVWWSDIYPPHGGPTDRLRRVDVWVPEKRAKTRGWETEDIVKWVVFVVLALLVAYGAIRLQMLELEKDQSYGFKELWGYKLDDLLRGRLVLAEK